MNAADIETRLREDTPFYARHLLKIADKGGNIIPFNYSAGQLALDGELEKQRAAGKPMRAIALKARQVGISTSTGSKLLQGATMRPNHNCVVVAHDRDTGAKLFRMVKRMYDYLPEDPAVRPDLAGSRRGREMHFLNGGKQALRRGAGFPDSSYLVDTAGEFQAGRGGTYLRVHCSEAAFWDALIRKLTALKNAVPPLPDSLLVIESTANGHNDFKGLWDDAEAGINDYVAFFWPWWKEAQYTLPFANDDEKERFRVGDTSQSRFAEGEQPLFDPGPVDTLTGEHVPLTLEQLHWRRRTIANECSGKIEQFQQEYPATPAEAFVASARQAFDANLTRGVLIQTAVTDPRNPTPEHPGPHIGRLVIKDKILRPTPNGDSIVIPTDVAWVNANDLELGETSEWRIWGDTNPRTEGQYVVGVDVSGGEVEVEGSAPAFHAIEVIDHKTREQVAEYRSRIDPDLLAEQVYLACLMFNMPWVAIEITGSWGGPVARKMWNRGYRYPYLYFQKKTDRKVEKTESRLGWDTNPRTKPLLLSNMGEMLREGVHGIKSYTLAMELSTLVRHPNGKTGPERGKFSDLFMAYAIAQFVAGETPIKRNVTLSRPKPRDSVTGY